MQVLLPACAPHHTCTKGNALRKLL